MISKQAIAKIRREVQDYWRDESAKKYFLEMARGHEIGHRIADLVDEKTTALLTVNHLTKHQHSVRGARRVRSMGDVWLDQNGICSPINVKTGIVGREGQPNLVSLKKLMRALIGNQIDSYYLLMIKFDLSQVPPQCTTYFVDMLDYLDFVTFDSGPGQAMLKAVPFFSHISSRARTPSRSLNQKMEKLLDLLEDGHQRLIQNRKRDLTWFQNAVREYLSSGGHRVTAETQEALNLR